MPLVELNVFEQEAKKQEKEFKSIKLNCCTSKVSFRLFSNNSDLEKLHNLSDLCKPTESASVPALKVGITT